MIHLSIRRASASFGSLGPQMRVFRAPHALRQRTCRKFSRSAATKTPLAQWPPHTAFCAISFATCVAFAPLMSVHFCSLSSQCRAHTKSLFPIGRRIVITGCVKTTFALTTCASASYELTFRSRGYRQATLAGTLRPFAPQLNTRASPLYASVLKLLSLSFSFNP